MMVESLPPLDPHLSADSRRRGVRRTVLVFAVIAGLIYVGFILSGVLAHGGA